MTTRADEIVRAATAIAPGRGDFVRALAQACGWGARSNEAPLLPCGVSHGVPWGVSLAITPAGVEPRVFVEAQADPPSPAAYWRAAAEVTRFAGAHGAQLDRLATVIDGLDAPFRLWHAVALGGELRWHAYLCIPPDGQETAHEALRRAGVPSLPPLRATDRITMIAMDLTQAMRVKAYVLMPDASSDELAALHDHARGAIAGDAQRFARAMLGDDRRIWWLAALGYTTVEPPATCALHFGVPRHVEEPTATTRVRAWLRELALPADAWERARGAHHFVTFQRRDGAPRVTTYFLPEVVR
jgi:hypothetical protein